LNDAAVENGHDAEEKENVMEKIFEAAEVVDTANNEDSNDNGASRN
jgi:hypothetical protein